MIRLLLSFCLLLSWARAATSLTQNGITWTFDTNYTTGQYANGDYYVVASGGLTITDITPASTIVGTRTRAASAGGGTVSNSTINGSMVNPNPLGSPDPGFPNQGFDAYLNGGGNYIAALNVARPGGNTLNAGNPLVVAAGSSLVSSISNSEAGTRPALSDAAILTVVSSAPSSGAFRPPYCGSDKSLNHNKSELNYTILPSLTPVAHTPALATVEAYFAKSWIEIATDPNQGRYYHPSNNQPDYGADMAAQLQEGELSLLLNYTSNQKETLYVRLVQYGIDIYGCAANGGDWYPGGGLNQGRKMPILLAGLALNDSAILAYANAGTHMIFQEDDQVFVSDLAEESVVIRNGYESRPRQPYVTKGATVTFTSGTPGTVNWSGHGLGPQQPVTFSGGTLPPEIVSGTVYWTCPQTIAAASVYTGMFATILSVGSTNWVAIGAAFDFADVYFISTGTGSGTGTATGLTQNTFRLSTQAGGSAMSLSTAGSGTITGSFTMIGVPEWGEKHSFDPTFDGSNWSSFYRNLNYTYTIGAVLTAWRITGAKAGWNYQPIFDYYDRVWTVTPQAEFTDFTKEMWAAYRNYTSGPTLNATTMNITTLNVQ